MEPEPRVTFAPRCEGTWRSSFYAEEQLPDVRAKGPEQGDSWVLKVQGRGPGSVSPKMAKPVNRPQPAAQSSTCRGRTLWRTAGGGGRLLLNLHLC